MEVQARPCRSARQRSTRSDGVAANTSRITPICVMDGTLIPAKLNIGSRRVLAPLHLPTRGELNLSLTLDQLGHRLLRPGVGSVATSSASSPPSPSSSSSAPPSVGRNLCHLVTRVPGEKSDVGPMRSFVALLFLALYGLLVSAGECEKHAEGDAFCG